MGGAGSRLLLICGGAGAGLLGGRAGRSGSLCSELAGWIPDESSVFKLDPKVPGGLAGTGFTRFPCIRGEGPGMACAGIMPGGIMPGGPAQAPPDSKGGVFGAS